MDIADGFTLAPRLVVAGAARAIDYYKEVFAAKEIVRYAGPDGKIVHAEIAIGDARIALKDDDATDRGPAPGSPYPVLLMASVADVDAVAKKMVAAGAQVVFPVEDRPEEGRGGRLADPFGHVWVLHQAAR
jgi:uncharacterized glyoxalase superfamily protein PhnB